MSGVQQCEESKPMSDDWFGVCILVRSGPMVPWLGVDQ